MKINKNLFAVGISALVLTAACKKQDNAEKGGSPDNLVRFSTTINGQLQTKAVGNKWDANDAIGVFMKNGIGLSNASAINKKYVTNGNGNFSPSAADQNVFFPADGSKVDFVAYYPYAQSLTANKIPVNVAAQTSQAAIDLLYSANAKDLSKSTPNAQLVFDHQLTKVEITVKNGEGVPTLAGLTTTLNGLATKSEFDLATGALAAGTDVAAITALKTEITSAVKAEAIVIPTDAIQNGNVVFAIGAASYKWTLPSGLKFEKGKKYLYDIELRKTAGGGEVAVNVSAVITDWTDVPGGSHVVGQDGETEPETPTNPNPGTEQTLFFEDFGTVELSSKVRPKVAAYEGYLNKQVTYTDEKNAVDLRSITTSTNHLWFPANKDAEFNIAGINLAGASKMKLSFDIAFNLNKDFPTGNHEWVKITLNGKVIAVPAKSIPTANNNVFETVTIDLASFTAVEAKSTLVFSTSPTNTTGIRIDNIKLVGTK